MTICSSSDNIICHGWTNRQITLTQGQLLYNVNPHPSLPTPPPHSIVKQVYAAYVRIYLSIYHNSISSDHYVIVRGANLLFGTKRGEHLGGTFKLFTIN